MKLRFLGTGTSTGVPQIGCNCRTCTSSDVHDKRLRCSAILYTGNENILIDAGPDLRTQLIDAGSPSLDALLVTHSHYDHVGGLIDMRSYCYPNSFPIYCQKDVEKEIREFFPYCFVKNLYPGVPTFTFHTIKPYESFRIGFTEFVPVAVMHFKLQILGFRIGKFAYITDCKTMPQRTIDSLKGVDTLVINALRIDPHMSHLSLAEALSLIEEIKPRVAYLTHMSHGIGRQSEVSLPEGVHLAYDGLVIEF